MQRLHIFIVGLAIELLELVACRSIVADETTVVLIAVELKHINRLRVRAPCHICEVTVCGVTGLEVDELLCREIIDAERHLVTRLACHRIFVGSISSDARTRVRHDFGIGDVDLRIVGHHRLIHAIEREFLAVGTPEETTVDAEFVAVHALTVDDVTGTVCRQLAHGIDGLRLTACRGLSYIELPVLDVSQRTGSIAEA
jgi:hypothetical protein